jgi:hypothetical protein
MNNTKRKSVVLLFTLLTLVAIFALIAQSSNITNKFFSSTNKSIVQTQINRLLLDTISILKNAKKNLQGEMKLDNRDNIDTFLGMMENIPIIPISENITVSPPQVDYEEGGKMYIKNFASIGDEQNATARQFKILFEQLCLYHNISDEYLLSTYMKKFKNSPIVTSKQIDSIIEDYYKQTKDKAIYEWRKSVTYIDVGGTDSNEAYLDGGLQRIYDEGIFSDSVIKDTFGNSEEIKKFKFDIDGMIDDQEFKASFVFDFGDTNSTTNSMNTKRASNIEIFF